MTEENTPPPDSADNGQDNNENQEGERPTPAQPENVGAPTPTPATPPPEKPADTPQPEPAKPVPAQPAEAPIDPARIKAAEEIVKQPITRQVEPDTMTRRSFVKWLTIGWASFAAIVAGYGALVTRFMFPNVLFEPKQSFRAGFPDEYPIGEVSERWKAQHAVWIVRDSEKIYALSTVCTHLGCTPNWLSNESKFKCPCHGSGFYKTGINFEGPAPRPLERFRISLTDDGELLVDKTKKFQQEKGEWNDSESYLSV